MRTKLGPRGWPRHVPRLAPPILLLSGAFLLDLAGVLTDRPRLWAAGGRLAGFGLVVTVLWLGVHAARAWMRPGRVPSLGSRPPTARLFSMLFALALFALARWVRGAPEVPPERVLFAVQALALIGLLGVAVSSRRYSQTSGAHAASARPDRP